jgi:hypothetical protein
VAKSKQEFKTIANQFQDDLRSSFQYLQVQRSQGINWQSQRHDEDRAPTPPIVSPYWEPLQNGTLFATYPTQMPVFDVTLLHISLWRFWSNRRARLRVPLLLLVDTFMRRYLYSWTNVTTGTPFERDQVAFFDILANYTTHSRTVQWSGIWQ